METRWKQLSPVSVVGRIDLDFSADHLLASMKKLEEAHWHYMDNYSSKDRFYPKMNFFQFAENIFRYQGITEHIPFLQEYSYIYDKHKKSLPTAGTLLVHKEHILLVCVRGSTIFTLPKGKRDPTDTSLKETAIRETKEETGLDVSDVISEDNVLTIQKTKLYLVETDELIIYFDGYNKNEIADIKWFSFSDVRQKPTHFSKQVRTAVSLLSRKDLHNR